MVSQVETRRQPGDCIGHSSGAWFVDVDHCHLRSLSRQPFHCRGADSGGSTGDDRPESLVSHVQIMPVRPDGRRSQVDGSPIDFEIVR
jgi:hypothetical protein